MRWSVRHQLLLAPALLLLGTVALSTWLALAAAAEARQQTADQLGRVAATLDESQFPLTDAVLQQMAGLSGAEFALFDGPRPAARSTGLANADLSELRALTTQADAAGLGEPAVVAGKAYAARALHLKARHPNAGADLFILYPRDRLQEELWRAVRPAGYLAGAGSAAALLLAVLFGRRLVRQVRDCEAHTRRIAAGDFTPAPLPAWDDELRDLTGSVNDMARQMAQYEETSRRTERWRLLGQISGGLAHQLRNAVTGARLAVQLHARGCAGGDAEALGVALRQLALVEANVRRFLDLGREEPAALARIDFRPVVTAAVELLMPQSKHALTDLRWTPPLEPVEVIGDAGQLGHLVLNLVGNAMEAAGPGGWVELLLTPSPEQVTLDVRDSGPGPAPEVAAKLFEPFVTGKPEGVGLGLAVARRVAIAHQGALTWHRDGEATVFRATLPAADRACIT